MKYLAILGREPKLSLAELESLFSEVRQISPELATFTAKTTPSIDFLGGSLKLAVELDQKPLDFLQTLPEGKITFGLSDYSSTASAKSATTEALKLKKILVRHGRSVRIVENKTAVLSTATSLHNGLSGKNARKVELIKTNHDYYRVIGVQNIDAYARRDQARPARDARVGMLPPKLAQILINLCGPITKPATLLDPFCGTGVLLQEALLMGFHVYGTDIDERMVKYSEKNLDWLLTDSATAVFRAASGQPVATGGRRYSSACQPPDSLKTGSSRVKPTNSIQKSEKYSPEDRKLGRAPLSVSEGEYFQISQGDATNYKWPHVDAVACEGYLGRPFSNIPADIALKTVKQECQTIILGFLKNLSSQIEPNTPVVLATPAWLRPDQTYSRLKILDDIENMGYNVSNKTREGLLYHREGQIVARDIIILRKK